VEFQESNRWITTENDVGFVTKDFEKKHSRGNGNWLTVNRNSYGRHLYQSHLVKEQGARRHKQNYHTNTDSKEQTIRANIRVLQKLCISLLTWKTQNIRGHYCFK